MHRKMSSSSIHALMFAAMIGTAAGSLVAQQETAARPAVHGHDQRRARRASTLRRWCAHRGGSKVLGRIR